MGSCGGREGHLAHSADAGEGVDGGLVTKHHAFRLGSAHACVAGQAEVLHGTLQGSGSILGSEHVEGGVVSMLVADRGSNAAWQRQRADHALRCLRAAGLQPAAGRQ